MLVLVAQTQFALTQPRQFHRIESGGQAQGLDLGVERAVLRFSLTKLRLLPEMRNSLPAAACSAKARPMRILNTNDDGIHAQGFAVLERIAAALSDDVWAVAPADEQSRAGHSLTLTLPLRLRRFGERKTPSAAP